MSVRRIYRGGVGVEIIRSADGGAMRAVRPTSRPDADVAVMLAALNTPPGFDMSDVPIGAARRFFDLFAEAIGPHPDPVSILPCNARTLADELPVEVILPKSQSPMNRPILIWYHGGGWVTGSLKTARPIACHLADSMDAVVVSVGYRLAPEHSLDDAVDDAIQAAHWTSQYARFFGGDPARIAVGGDSAGGHLATMVAAEMARNCLHPAIMQLLIYPATDLVSQDYPSAHEHKDGGMLNRKAIEQIITLLNADEATRQRLSPLHNDISLQPQRTVMLTAGIDPIRDQGFAYAQALSDAGKSVDLLHYPSMFHGGLNGTGYASSIDALRRLGLMGRADLRGDLEAYMKAIDPTTYPRVSMLRTFGPDQGIRTGRCLLKMAADPEIHSGMAEAGVAMVTRTLKSTLGCRPGARALS